MKINYQRDNESFPHDAYKIKGYSGVAWDVLGWVTMPNEDTEWTGEEEKTGEIAARMIGDDKIFTFQPEDATPLNDGDYCCDCGQIGCGASAV